MDFLDRKCSTQKELVFGLVRYYRIETRGFLAGAALDWIVSMPISSLASRIANEVAALIEAGDLTASAHLSTQALAARFEVSRSPVREALAHLSTRGLVEKQPHRGFFVKHGSIKREASSADEQPTDLPDLYHRLAEDWIHDAIPGEVTEQWLRDRYSLTKAQLSEILSRAAQDGWAERKQGYGWRFLNIIRMPEMFEQLYRFRSVIEPAGFLEPTFALDDNLVHKQRQTQESLLAGDVERWPVERVLRSGTDFHEDLALCSGNALIHQAVVRANRMRRLLERRGPVDRERLRNQSAEHLQILELLVHGENIEAAAQMRRHLLGVLKKKWPSYRSLFDQAEETEESPS